MSTPEGIVVKDCLDYLRAIGAVVIRNNTGRRGGVSYGSLGSSDIIVCLRGGRFLAVECKIPGGKVTQEQRYFLDDVRKLGGIAVVAHSVEDLAEAISAEGVR